MVPITESTTNREYSGMKIAMQTLEKQRKLMNYQDKSAWVEMCNQPADESSFATRTAQLLNHARNSSKSILPSPFESTMVYGQNRGVEICVRKVKVRY